MQTLEKSSLKAWEKAKAMKPEEITSLLIEKGLIGRGGACFPAGKKWEFAINAEADEKFVICNADEGEPGTFKDKFIINKNPETLVEGILIACNTIGANQAYIYLRREYRYLEQDLNKVINKVIKEAGTDIKIEIFVGAGAYICGEETAIINSMEGKRGNPHYKPPFPAVEGLFGKPTVINNVETLVNVPLAIINENWDANLRLFSISGNVKKPGVYELPLGVSLHEIAQLGEPEKNLKAIYFGCAGGCIPFNKEQKIDPESIKSTGCMLGSCAIIAVDESQSIIDMAANIAKFFEFESCGKCTPCREGNMRVLALLEKISLGYATHADIELLEELSHVIKDSSLCGLGQSSTIHLLTALKYFREEFEEKCKSR